MTVSHPKHQPRADTLKRRWAKMSKRDRQAWRDKISAAMRAYHARLRATP